MSGLYLVASDAVPVYFDKTKASAQAVETQPEETEPDEQTAAQCYMQQEQAKAQIAQLQKQGNHFPSSRKTKEEQIAHETLCEQSPAYAEYGKQEFDAQETAKWMINRYQKVVTDYEEQKAGKKMRNPELIRSSV